MMIGAEELTVQPGAGSATSSAVRLELSKTYRARRRPAPPRSYDVSLAVRGGEIVGIAGVSGKRPAAAGRGPGRPARGRKR